MACSLVYVGGYTGEIPKHLINKYPLKFLQQKPFGFVNANAAQHDQGGLLDAYAPDPQSENGLN